MEILIVRKMWCKTWTTLFFVITSLVCLCYGATTGSTPSSTTDPTPTVGPYCLPVPAEIKNGPAFPKFPENFQTKVEANILNKGYSAEAEWSHDKKNNRGWLKLLVLNKTVDFYSDYNVGEGYLVHDEGCVTLVLNETFNDYSVPGNQFSHFHHLFSIGHLFPFEFPEMKYFGEATVRGIDAIAWRGCVSWGYSNYTLDFYMSNSTWTSTENEPIPVRIQIQGVAQINGELHYFDHQYELFDFRPYAIEEDSAYQTPRGVYCPLRQKTKAVPKLPSAYSFRTEFVMPFIGIENGIILTYDVWYDYVHKILRYDYGDPRPWTEIHDFDMGVRYKLRRDTGECKIGALNVNNTMGGIIGNLSDIIDNKDTLLRMKNPAEFFHLDDSFIYVGKHHRGSVPCDLYNTEKKNFTVLPSQPTADVVIEVCVLDERFVEIGDHITGGIKNVPVSAEIYLYMKKLHSRQNFYDFEKLPNDLRYFDISPCYAQDSKERITIEIKGDYYSLVYKSKTTFIENNIHLILKITNLNPIRLQNVQLDWSNNTKLMYLSGTILERIPPRYIFTEMPHGYIGHIDYVYEDVASEEECGYRCQEYTDKDVTKILCNSYSYCQDGGKCSLSLSHLSSDPQTTTVKPDGQCKKFNRNVDGHITPEVSLKNALRRLKNTVDSNSYMVNFTDPRDVNNIRFYTAQAIRSDVIKGDGDDSDQNLKHFLRRQNNVISEPEMLVLDNIGTVSDCAAACLRNPAFTCETFDFCNANGGCALSAYHADKNPEIVTHRTGCDLYARNYIDEFVKYPGQNLPRSDGVEMLDIISADQCAFFCANHEEFECKSFDFCGTYARCTINKKHVSDVPSDDIITEPICDHYSKKYIGDFKLAQRNIKPVTNDVITSLTYEECAKRCIDRLGNKCKGFDYCSPDTSCYIGSNLHKPSSELNQLFIEESITTTANRTCDHYTRTYFDQTDQPIQPNAYYGHSDGAMAGLGIGMILLGIVLTVVILSVVYVVRGGSVNDIRVNFMRME